MDARDLPELLAKMDDYNGDAITRLAMKLMAYTFVRTSEELKHLGQSLILTRPVRPFPRSA